VYIRLMPTFERNLSKLQSDTNRRKKKNRKLQLVFAKILCRTKEERTFYKFASLMLKEERELKLKIFPLLGFAVIFPFIFLFNTLSTGSYEEMKSGNSFMVIYFALIMIPSVVQMLEYSGNYKGQWIFYAAPIKNKSIVYSATLKASIMNYFIPILAMLSVIFLWIFSFKIILDLVVVLLATIALTLVSYGIFKKGKFPFTSSHEHTQTNAFFKVFGSMFIVGLMAALHAVVLIIPYGLPIYAFILLISIFIGWKLMFSKG
jgi:ABC-2 type transport system permease protein